MYAEEKLYILSLALSLSTIHGFSHLLVVWKVSPAHTEGLFYQWEKDVIQLASGEFDDPKQNTSICIICLNLSIFAPLLKSSLMKLLKQSYHK